MAVAIVPHDRVEYILEHLDFDGVTIPEPIGWNTDNKEYGRVEEYDGIFTKFSTKLIFTGEAKDYIKMIYEIYGPNTNLMLRRRERHPRTNLWQLSYIGYLDLFTYKIKSGQVRVDFYESGLEEQLKAREDEAVEIERLDTLDGLPLPPLKTETVLLKGRRIFLQSIFDIDPGNNYTAPYNQTNGNQRGETVGVPLRLSIRSHENAQPVMVGGVVGDNSFARNADGNAGVMFFTSSDRDRTIRVKFDISFRIYIKNPGNDQPDGGYDDIVWSMFWFRLATYNNGANFNYKGAVDLFKVGGDSIFHPTKDQILSYNNRVMTFSFDQIIPLGIGESLSLQFSQLMQGRSNQSAHLKIQCLDIDCNLTIEEDSFFESSTSKFVLNKELGDRLLQIATSRNDILYSEALGRTDIGYVEDGVNTGALNGFAHGQWVRGFDALPVDEENKYKAFTTSFKDYMQNLKTTWKLSMGIEKIGLTERIRIEKKSFFFQQNVTIHIGYRENGKWIYPRVKEFEREVEGNQYYSSVKLGYEKGGENEEAMGLDEYNTKTTFSTPVSRLKKTFEMVSKYIWAAYPREFIRRKPEKLFPTTDHANDQEIFGMDLKRGLGGVFEERVWEDDFAQAPKNVFSPSTATNLRLSPFNLLLRHGWDIVSGIFKEPYKYVRYSSSDGNSKLTTQKIGGNEYAENGNIVISELGDPIYTAEWLNFDYPVDFDMIQQVEGSTTLPNGKKIPNFYGLVQFRNDEGDLEKGFLFNLKPQGKGKWKLLKSYR